MPISFECPLFLVSLSSSLRSLQYLPAVSAVPDGIPSARATGSCGIHVLCRWLIRRRAHQSRAARASLNERHRDQCRGRPYQHWLGRGSPRSPIWQPLLAWPPIWPPYRHHDGPLMDPGQYHIVGGGAVEGIGASKDRQRTTSSDSTTFHAQGNPRVSQSRPQLDAALLSPYTAN